MPTAASPAGRQARVPPSLPTGGFLRRVRPLAWRFPGTPLPRTAGRRRAQGTFFAPPAGTTQQNAFHARKAGAMLAHRRTQREVSRW